MKDLNWLKVCQFIQCGSDGK